LEKYCSTKFLLNSKELFFSHIIIIMTKKNCILNYSTLTIDYIKHTVEKYMHLYDLIINDIIQQNNEDLAWVTIVKPFIDLNNTYVELALLDMKDFHINKDIRDICNELSTSLSIWLVEQSMRKDIYEKYKYYYMNQYKIEEPFLSNEENTYFNNMMENYKLMGLDLPNDMFEKLKDIKKETTSLCNTFQQNLGEENYIEYIKPSELDGLPDKFIKDRLNENNMVKMTLKYPDIIPVMEYANNRNIRKHFSTLFKSRCNKENTIILEKVIQLRKEMAHILGYDNYADYKLVKSMAKTTYNVNQFLLNLADQIKPILTKDLDILNSLHGSNIEMWDVMYYMRLHTEKTCNFNKEELKQYFPINTVINGTFEIYQKLLGFTFVKQEYNDTFWHETVELYKVLSLDEEDNLVGYFYLDLYPREGKFSHAACFPFITKSNVSYAVATMACNFGQGNLTFDEVETFFHEFGHVMHHLSSSATISSMSSFSCEHDFVETPSQMFEEWCYKKESLMLMSKDLPDDMILKLNKSRKLFQGYHYARQLVFGFFDIIIHSTLDDFPGNKKPNELFSIIQKDILKLDTIDGTSEPASFSHIMGGYDAGYYGYAWSLVYAKDLFSVFNDNKLLDTELGLRLRKEILSQGSIRKSIESVKIFLGRDPSNKLFIDSINPEL